MEKLVGFDENVVSGSKPLFRLTQVKVPDAPPAFDFQIVSLETKTTLESSYETYPLIEEVARQLALAYVIAEKVDPRFVVRYRTPEGSRVYIFVPELLPKSPRLFPVHLVVATEFVVPFFLKYILSGARALSGYGQYASVVPSSEE